MFLYAYEPRASLVVIVWLVHIVGACDEGVVGVDSGDLFLDHVHLADLTVVLVVDVVQLGTVARSTGAMLVSHDHFVVEMGET